MKSQDLDRLNHLELKKPQNWPKISTEKTGFLHAINRDTEKIQSADWLLCVYKSTYKGVEACGNILCYLNSINRVRINILTRPPLKWYLTVWVNENNTYQTIDFVVGREKRLVTPELKTQQQTETIMRFRPIILSVWLENKNCSTSRTVLTDHVRLAYHWMPVPWRPGGKL